MEKLYIFHLVAAFIYLTFGTIVLLRNRESRLHRVFAFIMGLFTVVSIMLFLSENPKAKDNLAQLSAHVYFVLLPLLPSIFLRFVFNYTQKTNRLYSKITFGVALTLSAAFIMLALDSNYYTIKSYGFYYISEVAYYAQWQQVYMNLAQLMFIFLSGLISIIIIIRYGISNIDFRVRRNTKTIAAAYFLIFFALIQEQVQFILMREKFFFFVSQFTIFLGSAILFYHLIKKGIRMFSSSLLAENILENLTYPVCVIDESGRIIYHNDKMRVLSYMPEKKLNGTNIFSLLPTLNLSLDELLSYSEHGLHHIRSDFKDAFKNITKVIISCQSIYSFTGGFQGIIFNFEDLEKKPVNQAFNKSVEDRMIRAVEASGKGFWDWDIKNGALYFSEETYDVIGYTYEDIPELNFTNWKKLIHPDDVDNYFNLLNDNLKGKTSSFVLEYRVKSKSGKWIWLLDQGRVIEFDEKNNPTRMSGMFTDISPMKSVQLELEESRKKLEHTLQTKDALINLLSTDIREPFNAIIGLTEILNYSSDLNAKEKEFFLSQILYQSHRSFRLIETILDYSRFEQEGPKIQKRSFSLKKLIREIESEMHDYLNSKKKITVSGFKDLKVFTDREILKRILRILMQIVFSHAGESTPINLKVTDNKKSGVIIYLDINEKNVDKSFLTQMKGINKEAMGNISRMGSTTISYMELYVVNKLIDYLGGNLTISNTEHEMIRFNLSFPV